MKINKDKKFPTDFLWGVAYSAHQVEGNNNNNDWWAWEMKGKTKEQSGTACDSWNRYKEDHQLAYDLGCNAFRFSLEWSRIEPREGEFSQEALEHYQQVLLDLKSRRMRRVVTLWHWTLPLWLVEKYGGWYRKETVRLFARYCEKVIDYLGEEIDLLIVFNEPRLILNRGYLLGQFPPGKKNPWHFFQARNNLVKAYLKCFDLIKKKRPEILVGITQFCNDFDFVGSGKILKLFVEQIESFYNWYFFDQIKNWQDFVGINYYNGYEISLFPPFVRNRAQNDVRSDMRWGFSPEGIYELVMDAWKKYQKPVYIFENGAADEKDEIREVYIRGHLNWLAKAVENGAKLKGYFYWSLLDNFEWLEGYWPKFGLVAVDRQTFKRQPRSSYYKYQEIIKKNRL